MDEVCERNNFSITIQHFCEFSQKQRALDFINSVSGFVNLFERDQNSSATVPTMADISEKNLAPVQKPLTSSLIFRLLGVVVGLARFFACCNRVLTDFELQTKKQF